MVQNVGSIDEEYRYLKLDASLFVPFGTQSLTASSVRIFNNLEGVENYVFLAIARTTAV